jgi:hypothetical protein
MGWSDCGTDKAGRPIGYAFSAVCDHVGCDKEIDRGLSHACGGMHGDDEISCDKYYCEEHAANIVDHCDKWHSVCDECYAALKQSGDWSDDNDDGVLSDGR